MRFLPYQCGLILRTSYIHVFSRLCISHITSGLGEPMLTHKPLLDSTNMKKSKILVEAELDKPFSETNCSSLQARQYRLGGCRIFLNPKCL